MSRSDMKLKPNRYAVPLALVALLATALILLFIRKDGTLKGGGRDFLPANHAAVDKFVFTHLGESLTLNLADEGVWMVNGGSLARTDRVTLLFAFMLRLEIVSPVSKQIREDVTSRLRDEGTRVQIYVHGRLEKDFRIYYNPADIKGTYMMLTNRETPYMVRLKGYQGDNLEGIFDAERRGWQDNIWLDLAPEDIREVHVDYPLQEAHSFVLYRGGPGEHRLSGQAGRIPDEQVDVQEMEDYLHFFSNIRFEYAEGDPAEGIASFDAPFAVLRVITTEGNEYALKGYRLNTGDDDDAMDMGRFAGLIHGEQDTVILEYADMDPVLRRLEDFQKN